MDDTEGRIEDETDVNGESVAVEAEDTELGGEITQEFKALIERIGGLEAFVARMEEKLAGSEYTDGVGAGGGGRRSVDTSRLSPYEKILFGLGKT